MSIVTVQRSPSPSPNSVDQQRPFTFPDPDTGPNGSSDKRDATDEQYGDEPLLPYQSDCWEQSVTKDGQVHKVVDESGSKCAAVKSPTGSGSHCHTARSRSLSECYFAVKGAAVLRKCDAVMLPRSPSTSGGEIQQHLQAMLGLLRPQDSLKMAVRLQNLIGCHTRYMAIVSTLGRQDGHEACVLGIDHVGSGGCTTIGLVLPIWASTAVELDGDGGISIESANQQHTGTQHIFKPVSVQAMWSVFQCLHRELSEARTHPYYPGGWTHEWVQYYSSQISSPEAFQSEWHYSFPDDSDLKADSVERYRVKPAERALTERKVRTELKDIMQSVDLDDVTSKDIRKKLEERLQLNLSDYKEYIDKEMLVILGQMDKPSQIFEYLYLGTEWNASNWEELRQNNVGYILNVTKEVDNFFPGQFNYMKIRVSDEASSELLKHWNRTCDFINRAKASNCAVLVHCKKGISRSSSTVIAYIMKENEWPVDQALNYVKEKRNCITPNKGFMEQLKTFNGMLEAGRNRRSAVFNSFVHPSPSAPTFQTLGAQTKMKAMDNSVEEFPVSDDCALIESSSSPPFAQQNNRNNETGADDVIVSSKSDVDVPLPSGLVIASENILKSCPGSTVDGDGDPFIIVSTEQHHHSSTDFQMDGQQRRPTSDPWGNFVIREEDLSSDAKDLPPELLKSDTKPVASESQMPEPIKQRLTKPFQQRITAHQTKYPHESPTLRDLQHIMMRTDKHRVSATSSKGSTSGTSTLSDTSSLESHSGDEDLPSAACGHVCRKNSKSSSDDSLLLGSSPGARNSHQLKQEDEERLLHRPVSLRSLNSSGHVKRHKDSFEQQLRNRSRTSLDQAFRLPKKSASLHFLEKFFSRTNSKASDSSNQNDKKHHHLKPPKPARVGKNAHRAKSHSSPTEPENTSTSNNMFSRIAEKSGEGMGSVKSLVEKIEGSGPPTVATAEPSVKEKRISTSDQQQQSVAIVPPKVSKPIDHLITPQPPRVKVIFGIGDEETLHLIDLSKRPKIDRN